MILFHIYVKYIYTYLSHFYLYIYTCDLYLLISRASLFFLNQANSYRNRHPTPFSCGASLLTSACVFREPFPSNTSSFLLCFSSFNDPLKVYFGEVSSGQSKAHFLSFIESLLSVIHTLLYPRVSVHISITVK